jgi:hypothetical protein
MARSKNIKIKEISSSMSSKKVSGEIEKPKKKNRKRLILVTIVSTLSVFAIIFYLFYPGNKQIAKSPDDQIQEQEEENPNNTESPINGIMTTKEKAAFRPVGVMIENHPDARPQSGLAEADLVYEMVTEGGITRFFAVFGSNSPKEMGPVRSARVPFVTFADEYNAFYAHVGGSAEALSLISKTKDFYDLNQFSLGKYFWRDSKRYAPHNVYTTVEKLQEAARSKRYDTNGTIDTWQFKDDEIKENRGQTQSVSIDFSSALYKVTWNYDKGTNSYKRLQAGKVMTDRITSKEIEAKTIIVQKVSSYTQGQYTLMKHIGTGKATVYMDGKIINGTWSKSAQGSRTKFYDENNIELKITRGPIWLEIATNGVKESSN